MLTVHRNLALLLLLSLLLFPACSSNPPVLPGIYPDSGDSWEDEAETPTPRGVIANPADQRFHRPDCPECEKIEGRLREFCATPYEALNKGYVPCEYCDPLEGWR